MKAAAISCNHCERSREAYEARVKADTWQPAKLTAYNGQLLHEASSAVTMKTMKETAR